MPVQEEEEEEYPSAVEDAELQEEQEDHPEGEPVRRYRTDRPLIRPILDHGYDFNRHINNIEQTETETDEDNADPESRARREIGETLNQHIAKL